jgi:hypothetical protein
MAIRQLRFTFSIVPFANNLETRRFLFPDIDRDTQTPGTRRDRIRRIMPYFPQAVNSRKQSVDG